MKHIALAAFLVCLASVISPAHAVRLAQNESGQVAIVPLFNTLGGMDTLLKVSNGQDYSAVRIQLRNPEGQRIETFNIYLAPNEAWRAAVTEGPSGPFMTKSDPKCILGTNGASAEPLQSEVPLSSAFGYIEVLLMGHVDDPDVRSEIASRSCDALAARFTEGPWTIDGNTGISAPTDSLLLVAQLINVERGTLYGLQPIHLAEFRDLPFHVPPTEQFGLADAHDEGTELGETASVVCTDTCETKTWADPRDAVASLFLAVGRRADYVVKPGIGASSSFVILNPMHPYYEEGEFPSHDAGLYYTDSDNGLLNAGPCAPLPTRPIDTCPPALDLSEPEALSSFTMVFDQQPTGFPKPVPILGIPGRYPLNSIGIPAGEGNLDSGSVVPVFLGSNAASLFSNDQTAYFGMPSIVIGFTEYINKTLFSEELGRVRANYGTSALGVNVVNLPVGSLPGD
jgi:hypothetical protein